MIDKSAGRLAGLAASAVLAAGALATILPAASAGAASHVRGDAAVCGAVAAGFARCHVHTVTIDGHPAPAASAPSGYGPADLQSAYKTPSSTAGSGVWVAIVDAYDDPNAAGDLNVYRSTFGLPAMTCSGGNPCFSKVSQTGSTTSFPRANGGWAQEISLDVDMVSAVCPNCNILLVEATSNSFANLLAAEDWASAHANYVSNSWGGGEGSTETSYDSHFNKGGKVFTVSSGDSGYGVEYPAASRYVTAVGGTSLRRASNSRGWTETVWGGAGSGCSAYESQQSWQNISNITTYCSRRAVADVSAVADPNTGVAVYDSYAYRGQSGWLVFGGTSVASPVVASVYALSGNTNGASYAYSHTGSLFDVTSGSNGSCGNDLCTATGGWDGPTGLGTPDGTGAF